MSLINDALRRANQAKKNQPPPVSDGEPMRPAEASAKSTWLLVPVLLILLLVVVISFAGWFFWRGLRETSIAQNAKDPTRMTTPARSPKDPRGQEKIPPAFPAQPAANVSRTVAPETNVPKSSTAPAEESAINPDAVTNIAVVAPTPPEPLKLQGIFFRPSNPTVLINGKTLAVGESVSGARVLKISRQEVTLERDGQTIVLSLE